MNDSKEVEGRVSGEMNSESTAGWRGARKKVQPQRRDGMGMGTRVGRRWMATRKCTEDGNAIIVLRASTHHRSSHSLLHLTSDADVGRTKASAKTEAGHITELGAVSCRRRNECEGEWKMRDQEERK